MTNDMEKSQEIYETESSTNMTPVVILQPEFESPIPKKSVMAAYISAPPIKFADGDEGNPKNWDLKKKVSIGIFILMSCFVATFGTPIYVAGISSIVVEFRVNTTLAILPTSLYAYGLGLGALIATAVSEIYGRGIVYKVTLPLSFIFTIMGGAAQNYSTLAASRFLSGVLAGPCLALPAGVLNDLWNVSLDKMGTIFALLLALMAVYSTQVGPMVSGSLLVNHSWRWTFWVMAILLGVLALASFFFPETYEPQILRNRAKSQGLTVGKRGRSFVVFLVSVGRPLHMIIVEPFVLPNGLVLAVAQSIVFAYYIIYAILFEQVYGFSQYAAGMAFTPLFIGGLIAVPVLGAFDRLTYQKARAQAIASGTQVHPELRLYPVMLGVILQPISLFWLAWSGRPSIHWIVPALSGGLFGLSYVLNMISIMIYNNDVYYEHYGASVLAATTFLRFTISSSFPLFTSQMVHRLGFAWATSLLGFIAVAMIPIPWVFFKWGPNLRAKTRYLTAEVKD